MGPWFPFHQNYLQTSMDVTIIFCWYTSLLSPLTSHIFLFFQVYGMNPYPQVGLAMQAGTPQMPSTLSPLMMPAATPLQAFAPHSQAAMTALTPALTGVPHTHAALSTSTAQIAHPPGTTMTALSTQAQVRHKSGDHFNMKTVFTGIEIPITKIRSMG